MAMPHLSLSLQFADIADVKRHRAALPRHAVARWIRHALDTDADLTVRIAQPGGQESLNVAAAAAICLHASATARL